MIWYTCSSVGRFQTPSLVITTSSLHVQRVGYQTYISRGILCFLKCILGYHHMRLARFLPSYTLLYNMHTYILMPQIILLYVFSVLDISIKSPDVRKP